MTDEKPGSITYEKYTRNYMLDDDLREPYDHNEVGKLLGYLAASQSRERVYREALEKLASYHAGCDDGFYACPRSEDYFGAYEDEPVEARPCYCHNEIARAALTNNKLDEEKE